MHVCVLYGDVGVSLLASGLRRVIEKYRHTRTLTFCAFHSPHRRSEFQSYVPFGRCESKGKVGNNSLSAAVETRGDNALRLLFTPPLTCITEERIQPHCSAGQTTGGRVSGRRRGVAGVLAWACATPGRSCGERRADWTEGRSSS